LVWISVTIAQEGLCLRNTKPAVHEHVREETPRRKQR